MKYYIIFTNERIDCHQNNCSWRGNFFADPETFKIKCFGLVFRNMILLICLLNGEINFVWWKKVIVTTRYISISISSLTRTALLLTKRPLVRILSLACIYNRGLKLKLVGGPHSRDKMLRGPQFTRKKLFADRDTLEKPSK